MDLVIGTSSNPAAVDRLVSELKTLSLTGATLYIGYPILSTADQSVSLDAILTCLEHGIVVFDLGTYGPDTEWAQVEDRQAEIEIGLKSKLIRHKDLTHRRELAVPIHVVTYVPFGYAGPTSKDVIIAVQGQLAEAIESLNGADEKFIRPLNAAIQQVATIKPQNKRLGVRQEHSRGGKLKVIEREVANLDRWQKKGAIECPEGVQRIRGLAGSGKTVVLALKAAYLHARNPEWTIAVGFQTQSLYKQFRDLIRRFTYEHIGDEPNWDRIRVLHGWGGTRNPGLYSLITQANGLPCRDLTYGKQKYFGSAFEGVCNEALEELRGRPAVGLFDAILIDEAQDFGPSFFRLAYRSVKRPHRFVFAYDELQSLKETSLPGLTELFGVDEGGEPLVKLRDIEGQPQQDIILPVCYRNTPWSLSLAHALGFGIYRAGGLIQMFDEPSLWSDIGYEVVSGELTPGRTATLARRGDATPDFFANLLSPADAVQTFKFESFQEQAAWVAEQIEVNLTKDELEPGDILVIFADPVSVPQDAGPLIARLRERNIATHIAGVTRSPSEFFIADSVVISGIYRAKGNEAPMVYVLGAEYCFGGLGLIRRRNILFTAITRSRAWVRVCGVGPQMEELQREWGMVQEHNFNLSFTVPTPDELARLRRIHRDRTEDEIQRIEKGRRNIQETIEQLEREEITLEDLPESLRERLAKLLSGRQ